jgi:eukaryotic-like serine/threonine-protein kinase
MRVLDPLVLAPDVLVIPLSELPAPIRGQLGDQGEFALTQAQGRVSSLVVDRAAADLIREFTASSTIVDAVVRYSRERGLDPEQVLEDGYPVLRRCLGQGFLVPADSDMAQPRRIAFPLGQRVAGGAVLRCIRFLGDTEVYQLVLDRGGLAALKVLRATGPDAGAAFEREVEVLRHLDGRVAPRLLGTGELAGTRWLAQEWIDGMPVTATAAALRYTGQGAARLADLCRRVAEAYADLHDRGVVHGDVHPGNVLVSPSGTVRLLDFGLARLLPSGLAPPPRGGVPPYFAPDHASALLSGREPEPATPVSEQYSVGALLYMMLTGSAYTDFAIGDEDMLHQVLADDPSPFTRHGVPSWPEMEALVAAALAKDPARRIASRDLAERLRTLAPPGAPCGARRAGSSTDGLDALLDSILERTRPGGEWFEAGLPTAPLCSVAHGAAGTAIALHHVAVLRDDPDALTLADEWAVRAVREAGRPDAFRSAPLKLDLEVTGSVSPFHCLSGVHGAQALVSNAMHDTLARQRALDAFVAASRRPCDALDLTVGSAGTLLAAAILLEAVASDRVLDTRDLSALGNATTEAIWSQLDGMPPVGECGPLPYLGVAHGWAGVLLATLRWSRLTGAPLPVALPDRLEQLAALARPVGMGVRWSWTNDRGSAGASTMAGWCHGTAGHVWLWTAAHLTLRDDRWARLAERAAWDVYATPQPTANLCCGLAGQAYALLEMYRHTGEQIWLRAAGELATRAAVAVRDGGSAGTIPGSLHKGEVGVAVLAADLSRPEAAAMPFFSAPA